MSRQTAWQIGHLQAHSASVVAARIDRNADNSQDSDKGNIIIEILKI